ncbi:MAG: sulfatase-like hydrolase/transferase, partial [Chloroflexi bacterium]|nr:sulfatase-like hydrolase/transferase [Chloroflexota bacterium]
MVDQLRATALGLYGNPQVGTPHLEALAASGLCYEQAHAPCPVCVPSRVAFWSGRWPHLSGARTNGILMPEHEQHLLQPLKEAGYRTALFGKNHCFTPQQLAEYWDVVSEVSHGGPLDDRGNPVIVAARAWARHPDQNRAAYAAAVSPFPVEQHGTWLICDDTVRFLQQHATECGPDGPPFAVWTSIADPHTPYQVSEPYASYYPPESIILPPQRSAEGMMARTEREQIFAHLLGAEEVSDERLRFVMSIYYGMIAVIDEGVGRILATLDQLGLRERTLIVFLADHGDYMGERRLVRKTIALHDALTRVPLLLSW